MAEIKYRKEIYEIFSSTFEGWMDAEDKKLAVEEMVKAAGKTMESLSDDIQTGVDNGHSVDMQIALCKLLLST